MFGIIEKAIFQKYYDDGFDEAYVEYEKEIKVRVQKNRTSTFTTSLAVESGSSTTYFITMDLWEYEKDDRIIFRNKKYSITGVTVQPKIYSEETFYIRLDVSLID